QWRPPGRALRRVRKGAVRDGGRGPGAAPAGLPRPQPHARTRVLPRRSRLAGRRLMRFFPLEKLGARVAELRGAVNRERVAIPGFRYLEADPRGAEQPGFDDTGWAPFNVGDFWGGYDKVAWFRTTVDVPAAWRDRKLALRFLVGPRDGGDSTAETLLHVNGHALQGIDIWHEEAWLPPEEYASGSVQVALRCWSGVL